MFSWFVLLRESGIFKFTSRVPDTKIPDKLSILVLGAVPPICLPGVLKSQNYSKRVLHVCPCYTRDTVCCCDELHKGISKVNNFAKMLLFRRTGHLIMTAEASSSRSLRENKMLSDGTQ